MSKEQFRNWKPRGKLRVKYWIDRDKGQFDYWKTDSLTLFNHINDVVKEFQELGIKLTNRQLYYQIVGKNLIPNFLEVYKRLCKYLTDCRYGGLVDWKAIEDRGRVPKKHSEWCHVKSLIESAVHSYRLPRWDGQKYYVELYCEKQAGETVLKPIADKWHIYFGYNKGYSSASTMYDLAKRVQEQIQNGKEVKILYFGDHDPSGLDMIRDITKRIREFLTEGDDYTEPSFEVIPVSLTMEQIRKFNLPPNPAKFKDPRSKWYIKEFGKDSWELDAMNPLELRKLAEKSILEYLDVKKYKYFIEREKREIEALRNFGREYKNEND